MRELSAFLVAPTTSIREAIGVIDRGAAQIALVTEADQRLVGTLTDGDIRRALLRGIDLESPVEEIMFRDFRWLPVTAPESTGCQKHETTVPFGGPYFLSKYISTATRSGSDRPTL